MLSLTSLEVYVSVFFEKIKMKNIKFTLLFKFKIPKLLKIKKNF